MPADSVAVAASARVVERNVYTLFGSGEKQIRAPRIDSYRMDIIVRRKARISLVQSSKICRH